jgi:hypothetical protein
VGQSREWGDREGRGLERRHATCDRARLALQSLRRYKAYEAY